MAADDVEVTADDLSTYLSGRLDADDVTVSEVARHTEGWSRQTVSFRADWDGDSRRFVARIDNEDDDEERRHDTRNDIETEFRTMEAAGETDAPAPETYWYEPDESHLGGAFFLVEHRPGDAPIVWDLSDREELYAQWDGPSDLPSQFVDAVAEIHTLGPEDVPFLEDADPHEVVDRELDTYETIYEEAKLKEEPAVEEALRWFRANKPEVPETTLVHGDFRIGNTLIDGEDLSAVLDWELAQIGDPLYDLGYASTYYFAGKLVNPIERPELACSLLEREWFYDEYEKRTGREVNRDRVRYWQALSAFTMMTRGVSGAHRFREGETDDVRSAWFQYIVPGHIEDILSIVREDRT